MGKLGEGEWFNMYVFVSVCNEMLEKVNARAVGVRDRQVWKHKCCIVLEGVEKLEGGRMEDRAHKGEIRVRECSTRQAGGRLCRDRAVRLKEKLGFKGKKRIRR